jgi:hypothetical protein
LKEVSPEALSIPVVISDAVADGTTMSLRYDRQYPGQEVIVINGRYLLDPEQVANDLAEEVGHAQQLRDGVDFEGLIAQYPHYEDRPFEQEAKAFADRVCGYRKPAIPIRQLRPEPPGLPRRASVDSR